MSSTLADDVLQAAIEDYLTRVDKGEKPKDEEYLARYPECASGLREFFSDLRFIDGKLAEKEAGAHTEALARTAGQRESGPTASDCSDFHSAPMPEIKGFKVLEELGGGSQGVVYKAIQLGTKRAVALKVIREGAFATKSERRRFENEIELVSRLRHPHIVSVYECGRDAGRDYFAMEYVEGDPLDGYLSSCTLETGEALELFLQICDAISYAHQRGVIHRDLKPSNILIDASGQARIVDFGLAKPILSESAASRPALTRVGDFAGTWYYASPEQVKRDPALVDVRSEVYTLGLILYEMLTDSYPYPLQAEAGEDIARHILETPPVKPRAIRRDLDDEVETIILRCLSKEPERRYQSVAALTEDIRRYLVGDAIEAKRDSTWYVLRKAIRHHRGHVLLASAGLVALVVFAVTVSILYSQAVSARATTELRATIVRQSQAYVLDKLDELSWTSNRLQEVIAAHPDLPEIQRMRMEVYANAGPLLAQAVEGMPEDIHELIRHPGSGRHEIADQWLDEHQVDLAEIAGLLRTRRFVVPTGRWADTDLALGYHPGSIADAFSLGKAFVARALQSYAVGNHKSAVEDLDSARLLAGDIGDGRLMGSKSVAIHLRLHLCETVQWILNHSIDESSGTSLYVDWALRDPPLVEYRLAAVSERQRIAQLVEGASVSSGTSGSGHLDLDLLDELTDGYYRQCGLLSNELRDLARSISPAEALALVDDCMRTLVSWEALNARLAEQRASEVGSQLRAHRAWRLLAPVLPSRKAQFQHRAIAQASRSAMLLSALLIRYHAANGRWPAQLEDAIANDDRFGTIDPYTGLPFAYRLVGTCPLLYSVNTDRADDGGRPGDWGEPDTDVVFFIPGPSS